MTPIILYLENAFTLPTNSSNDFQLNHAFDNAIKVNGKMVNIAKLVEAAKVVDVSELAEDELDSYMDDKESEPKLIFG